MTRTATISPTPRQFATLVGTSDGIVAVRALVDRLAGSAAPVLITGPSGSGKEVVARLLHQRSSRAARPLVSINCAAVPRDLLEAELFGHEAGAFTGANQRRRGRFELADGGTLFLDELGDMPLEFQAKLLRVLETGEVERLGGCEPIPVDVRIVAATNVDLGEAIACGRFRSDLFFRLAVVELPVPGLAERPGDIPLLIEHFRHEVASSGQAPRFTAPAIAYLQQWSWPGNVRELRNLVTRAAALHPAGTIDEPLAALLLHGERRRPGHWLDMRPPSADRPERRRPQPIIAAEEVIDLKALLGDLEQAYIREALGRTAFGVAESARILGLNRTTLVEKMRRHNIARPDAGPPLERPAANRAGTGVRTAG